MRAFVSIFLFLLFLTQVVSSFVIDGAYWLNRGYVAENLCVNKDKPAMHCDGKCYLTKQVQKDAKSDATNSGAKKEKNETSVFLPVYYGMATVVPPARSVTPIAFYKKLLPKHSTLLLRPPCLFTA